MSVGTLERSDRLPLVLALALPALALRGVGTWSFLVPLVAAAAVFATQPYAAATGSRAEWLAVTGAGVGACVLVRLALPGVPVRTTLVGIGASIAAAIGEEIVFRRGLYGALERRGALIAVLVAALAFGIVHVPMYGWTIVPVDVGAGLVFGWQRWASGSWTSPAATHVSANLLSAI